MAEIKTAVVIQGTSDQIGGPRVMRTRPRFEIDTHGCVTSFLSCGCVTYSLVAFCSVIYILAFFLKYLIQIKSLYKHTAMLFTIYNGFFSWLSITIIILFYAWKRYSLSQVGKYALDVSVRYFDSNITEGIKLREPSYNAWPIYFAYTLTQPGTLVAFYGNGILAIRNIYTNNEAVLSYGIEEQSHERLLSLLRNSPLGLEAKAKKEEEEMRQKNIEQENYRAERALIARKNKIIQNENYPFVDMIVGIARIDTFPNHIVINIFKNAVETQNIAKFTLYPGALNGLQSGNYIAFLRGYRCGVFDEVTTLGVYDVTTDEHFFMVSSNIFENIRRNDFYSNTSFPDQKYGHTKGVSSSDYYNYFQLRDKSFPKQKQIAKLKVYEMMNGNNDAPYA